MSSPKNTHEPVSNRVAQHREKLQSQGLKRVEATVPEGDSALIRDMARILRDGGAEAEALRRTFRAATGMSQAKTGKELVAFFRASPLVETDIDFERDRSPARDVDFP